MSEETTAPSAALAVKIVKVQAAISTNFKQRHVTVETSTGGSYSYDYITEAALMQEIRPLLADNGVAVYYSDEIKQLNGNLAAVRVELTVVDSETGDSFTMHAEGIGTDKGDKAVNKAKTSAMRYLLWKWFLVPSDIDPEEENVERSARPPKSQIAFAKEEDVEALAAEVEAAGFDRAAFQATVDAERQQWEGIRQEWLDTSRARFEQAREKAAASK